MIHESIHLFYCCYRPRGEKQKKVESTELGHITQSITFWTTIHHNHSREGSRQSGSSSQSLRGVITAVADARYLRRQRGALHNYNYELRKPLIKCELPQWDMIHGWRSRGKWQQVTWWRRRNWINANVETRWSSTGRGRIMNRSTESFHLPPRKVFTDRREIPICLWWFNSWFNFVHLHLPVN